MAKAARSSINIPAIEAALSDARTKRKKRKPKKEPLPSEQTTPVGTDENIDMEMLLMKMLSAYGSGAQPRTQAGYIINRAMQGAALGLGIGRLAGKQRTPSTTQTKPHQMNIIRAEEVPEVSPDAITAWEQAKRDEVLMGTPNPYRVQNANRIKARLRKPASGLPTGTIEEDKDLFRRSDLWSGMED